MLPKTYLDDMKEINNIELNNLVNYLLPFNLD